MPHFSRFLREVGPDCGWWTPLKTPRNDKARLILVSLVVAIVIAAAIAISVWVLPPRYTERTQLKWVEFVAVNALLATYELRAYRKLRKSLSFWSIFLGVFLVYLIGLGYFFYAGNGVSMVTLALAGGAEFASMACVIYWILDVGPDSVSLDL